MPNGPIVDSHVHLWDPDRFRMPWLDALPAIDRPMGLAEYDAATEGLDVEAIVYLQVEVAPPLALVEARELVRLAEQDGRIRGIVPWAPLEYGDHVRLFLEELVALGPRIKGVRRITQDEPDPEFCLQPGFVRGAQLLAEFDLVCDLCPQLRPTRANRRIGAPLPDDRRSSSTTSPSRTSAAARWNPGPVRCATSRVCPTSSARSAASPPRPITPHGPSEQIKPYVLHALECFGEDRVLFGSDWPVATLASTYRRWVETLDELTADWSDGAKRKLWADNARRVYRL